MATLPVAPVSKPETTTDLWNMMGFLKSPVPRNNTHASLIGAFISLILIIATVLSFFFLVYGGIKWITSSGDKEAMTKAQQTISHALIGLALAFSAWAIIKLLTAFFGIDILEMDIPA